MTNLSILLASISLLLIGGCADAGQKTTGNRPALAQSAVDQLSVESQKGTDQCATHLQDMCGLFLYYYAFHQELPEKLDDLRTLPEAKSIGEFSCPVSNQPYIYDRNGKRSPSGAGQVILSDPAPSHGGVRLCIEIIAPQKPRQALVAKVIHLPESFFHPK